MTADNEAFRCPFCGSILGTGRSLPCQTCFVWWTQRHDDFHGGQQAGTSSSSSERIELESGFSLVITVVGLVFVLFAWVSAGAMVLRGSWSWYTALVALPLSLALGAFCLAVLAQQVLHALLPSRLELHPEGLHLRIWVTWGGVFSRFRRSDVLLKWDEIAGIAFGGAQGGATQVFISHRLGWDCYAGFTGNNQEASSIGNQLLAAIGEQNSGR